MAKHRQTYTNHLLYYCKLQNIAEVHDYRTNLRVANQATVRVQHQQDSQYFCCLNSKFHHDQDKHESLQNFHRTYRQCLLFHPFLS